MAEVRAVDLEGWEDRDKLVAIGHRFDLFLFQVRSEFNSCVCLNFYQHKLVCEIIAEVGKVSKSCSDFCEMTDSYRSIDSQIVCLEEDPFPLQPCEEVAGVAAVFDVSKASIAENVAPNTDVHRGRSFASRI